MYDEKTCTSEEAAWLVYGKDGDTAAISIFECHLTNDEDSPTGTGWYFASYLKGEDGTWNEHDGGCYWDYSAATDLESVIGETVPFGSYETVEIDYASFEAICFENDKQAETLTLALIPDMPTDDSPPKKNFFVKISETRELIVPVKANSSLEARMIVRDDHFAKGKYNLDKIEAVDTRLKMVPTARHTERPNDKGR